MDLSSIHVSQYFGYPTVPSMVTQALVVPWGLPVHPVQSHPICFHAIANGDPYGYHLWPHLATRVFSQVPVGSMCGSQTHTCVPLLAIKGPIYLVWGSLSLWSLVATHLSGSLFARHMPSALPSYSPNLSLSYFVCQ